MQSVSDSKKHIQEFQPERVTPVYSYITKKYLCEEDVISPVEGARDILNTLTFHIKESDPTMVWKSVRLCLPIKLTASGASEYEHFRIADNTPSCNIAYAASAYEVFSDMQLAVNGSFFTSQPNRFQGMLDRVYRGRDVMSFQSGGSLKPIVNRNLKKATEANGYYEVQRDDEKDPGFVQVHDTYSSVSRNAFDLTQSNPGFITRSAQFQQTLNGSAYKSESVLSMYMDIGIFQNKERKLPSGRRLYNDACPYLRDVMIRCTYDKLRSNFDSKYNKTIKAGGDFFYNRDMPSKLLEFATPVNNGIHGEPALPVGNWLKYFSCGFTSKPYLEVQFVQVPEQQLKPQYSLMALRHQHEISDPFNFSFSSPTADGFVKQVVNQRINSRLLEVPSKIYLWAGYSFNDKKSFFLGNTGNQRYLEISRLHLRMNTRPDALFEPTQLECYNIFKRITSNDMNFQTWSKSPIYVFDCQSFGQPEFIASNGELMTFDWTCEVSPTSLVQSEMLFLQNKINMKAMGYDDDFTFSNYFNLNVDHSPLTRVRKYVNWIPNRGFYSAAQPNPWGNQHIWIPDCSSNVTQTKRTVQLAYYVDRNCFSSTTNDNERMLVVNDPGTSPSTWTSLTEGQYLKKLDGQYNKIGTGNPGIYNIPEIWRIHHTLEKRVRFDNLIWAIWDANTNQIVKTNDQVAFWYIPESWHFTMTFEEQAHYTGASFQKRQIFNRLSWVHFQADGTINMPQNDPNISTGIHGKGIVRGQVSMATTTGAVVNRNFNIHGAAVQRSGYCPGPRAYPLSITGNAAQRAFSGVRNVGMPDGGNPAGNGQGNDLVRGGLAPENWIAQPANQAQGIALVPNKTYYKMINPYTGGGPNEHMYWIAFQPTYDQMNLIAPQRAWSRKIAWNATANPLAPFPGVDAGAALCGTISRPLSMAPNANQGAELLPDSYILRPQEVHVLKQVIERDVADTQTRLGTAGISYTIVSNANGDRDDMGAEFQIAGSVVSDQSITDDLNFSLNVLYEMGNDRYIVSKNGQMIQDNDVWTPTVIQKRSRVSAENDKLPTFSKDPRLQGIPKLERVKSEPKSSGFHSHY